MQGETTTTTSRTFYITPKWSLGEMVYLKTDIDQKQCILTGITAHIDGSLSYQLRQGDVNITCFGEELTNNKNYIM